LKGGVALIKLGDSIFKDEFLYIFQTSIMEQNSPLERGLRGVFLFINN